jgi:hypothetical protein
MTSTRPTFGPASWCENIDRPFRIRLPDGSYSTDNGCAWVAVGKERRCDLEGVRDNCPVTCDYCMCKDNPGTFSTRFSNSRDCQWVSENLSICSMQPSAEYNCPLTCGKCAEVPSAAPSNRPTTESPSKAITTTPSLSWCQDSTDQFSVEANTKDCSWVGKKKQVRCDLEGVRDNCPVICDYCLCKDNPRVFSTRVSIQRDCQWVSENLSVCYRLPLVEDNCPLTCGKCPARPSAAPSDKPSTESPSRAPTLSPSVSWCQDSTDQLSVNGNTRDCSWVAAKKQIRCNFGGISDNCPVTCDSCKCMDNPGTFLGKDFLDKTCQWVSEELSRCNVQPLAEYNCPLTCGKCSEPPSIVPSKAKNTEMPSAAPTISPSFSPVEIYENIQLQIGPLVGDMSMNDDNKKILEETLDMILSRQGMEFQYQNIKTSVGNQIVRQLSRRLMEGRYLQQPGDYMNFFDLIVIAQFLPDMIAEDANVEIALKTFFENPSLNAEIITALTSNTSSDADYFRNVRTLTYIGKDTNQIGSQNDDKVEGISFWNSNRILIIACSVAACVALVFIIAAFMYTRNRRYAILLLFLNNLLQSIGKNLIWPFSFFACNAIMYDRLKEANAELNDIEVFTSTNTSNIKTHNWVDVKPNKLQSNNLNQSNDGNTDVENTLNILEKVYSAESDDELSFQSYGYSLDDGIGASSFEHQIGTFMKGFNSDSDDGTDDESLGSFGTSSVKSDFVHENGLYGHMGNEDKPSLSQDSESDEEDPFEHLGGTQYERVCTVPPGKLGVVIDDRKMGHIVYEVKNDSPLKGFVFPGDNIIAVDDIDTKGMGARNITKIVASKSEMEKRITVASKKEVK